MACVAYNPSSEVSGVKTRDLLQLRVRTATKASILKWNIMNAVSACVSSGYLTACFADQLL